MEMSKITSKVKVIPKIKMAPKNLQIFFIFYNHELGYPNVSII